MQTIPSRYAFPTRSSGEGGLPDRLSAFGQAVTDAAEIAHNSDTLKHIRLSTLLRCSQTCWMKLLLPTLMKQCNVSW